MKKKFYFNSLRNITAACLAMVIFTTSSMIALAAGGNKSLMGEITVSGQTEGNAPFVLLNGENAFTGRTFISNGTIETPEAVTSTIKLGKLGYVVLSPKSTLTLNLEENAIAGTLSAGNAQIFNADGVEVKVQNLGNATTNVAPVNKAAQDDDDKGVFGNSAVGPILVFAGIVATAVILVVVNDDDDGNLVVSPVR